MCFGIEIWHLKEDLLHVLNGVNLKWIIAWKLCLQFLYVHGSKRRNQIFLMSQEFDSTLIKYNLVLEFSDKELIQLAKLLQNKIDAYDSRVPVEDYDMVLFPVELLNEEEPQEEDHMLRTLIRDRRTPTNRIEEDQVPIIVIPDEEEVPERQNEVCNSLL